MMSIQSMRDLLEQLNFQAQQTKALKKSSFLTNNETHDTKLHFSNILTTTIDNVSKVQTEAQKQAEDYMTGVPGVGLNDVMVSLQKSTIALNLGIQVRNKMVSAYQEVMNMTV